jgi:hypothetical protein
MKMKKQEMTFQKPGIFEKKSTRARKNVHSATPIMCGRIAGPASDPW